MKKPALDRSPAFVLDRIDRRMLRELQNDARQSDEALGRLVNLSPSGCRKRRQRLEEAAVIKGYVALVDQDLVELSEDVYVVIKLHSNRHDDMDAFDRAVKGVDEVMDCHAVTGEWDYVLRVVTRDMHDHDRLCDSKLSQLPGVDRLESSPAMRRIVAKTVLPL